MCCCQSARSLSAAAASQSGWTVPSTPSPSVPPSCVCERVSVVVLVCGWCNDESLFYFKALARWPTYHRFGFWTGSTDGIEYETEPLKCYWFTPDRDGRKHWNLLGYSLGCFTFILKGYRTRWCISFQRRLFMMCSQVFTVWHLTPNNSLQ